MCYRFHFAELLSFVDAPLAGREKTPINSSAVKSFNKHRTRRAHCTSHDVGYLLRHSPNSGVLTEPVRYAFLQGLKSHVTVLKLFEGTDAVKRELVAHVPFESDWREVFYFQRLLQPITSYFIGWLPKNRSLLLESINIVFETLQLMKPVGFKSLETTVFRNYSCQIHPGVVTNLHNSCHMPLTRLLSGLLCACHSQGINLTTDTCLCDESIMHWLFERCLQPIVFKSQVLNNFWKKNGMSVVQMVNNYHSFICNEMYYRDVYMLQLLTAYLPTDYVLLNLIQKFEVAKWFEPNYKLSKSSGAADRNLFIQNMCEEMLGTLITIIIERNNTDTAELTEEEVMEQKLINILFLDHWKHQNLMDELTRGNNDYSIQSILDTQLSILADESIMSRKKQFTLKPKYYDRVCVFFYHDSKENQSQSGNQLKALCQLKKDILSTILSPPLLPNFRPHLRRILCILEHPLFFHILFIILERAKKESELVTDYMTHQALFLISIGIQEEKLGNISGFKDCLKGASANSSFDFLPILAILSSTPSCADIRELVDWINSELLPKEQIRDISEQITAREDSEKKLIEEIQEAQTKAMDDLKKKQASFLVGFGSSDEDDDELIEKPDQEQSRVQPNSAGIGIQCLNSLHDRESIGCMFCQETAENQSHTEPGKFFVLPGHCASYSGLRKGQSTIKSLHDTNAVLTPATLDMGVVTKSCGHTFHFVCWDQFMKGSSSIYSQLVISPEEFKCPLCYSVCNTIIPLSQGLNYNAEVSETHKPPSFEQFLNLLYGITNAKFYTENAVNIATAFIDCFHQLPDRFHSVLFFTKNEDAFKMQAKCKEIAYAGSAPVDPSFIVNAMNNTVNYTIQSKNNEIMSLERLVSDEVSAHQRLVLRSIVHTAVIAKNVEFHQVCCQNTNTILDALLTSSNNPDSKTFDYDAFSLLVYLQFSLPHLITEVVQPVPDHSTCLNLLPTISLHVFKLLLYYRLIQILLCTNLDTLSADAEHDGVNRDSLFKLWTLRRKALPEKLRQYNFSMKQLHREVVRLILPFLRAAAMFYNLLLNLPFPTEISEKTDEYGANDDFEQVERLLKFIGCPGLMSCISEVFTTRNLEELIRNWFAVTSNFSLVYSQHIQHPSQIIFPYGGLVILPNTYIDILTDALAYDCPITLQRADEVIKCMVCGKYVCLSCFACTETYKQSAIDKPPVGPFTEHILQCSNGIGIGIWVKNAVLLLISVSLSSENLPATGTIQQVPYLDQFGEHDRELRKGSPLFLSPQGYKEINQIWMQNNVSGAIEKSNEDKPNFAGINWKSF
ncbi:E3 ubiquitin-protein ligase UBR1 [Oopsacas minuta]|uniref:E3 ubiquitin-protein ligase n=1 Tax=Oopsacas minuta TaxID=111878 RepID=A0AAV7KM56_9METZ|nr:E3 ubiquitin-protein ligase UBR1 [Oopsacas minuta]